MKKKIDVILLEHDVYDAENIISIIKQNDFRLTIRVTDKEDEFKDFLKQKIPDIVISNYSLPHYSGFLALEYVKLRYPNTPFIIITGTLDEETAAETVRAGAWEYVMKERLHRLPPAINNVLNLKEEKKKIDSARGKLKILGKAIEQASSAILITNKQGEIEYTNPKFTELTGYSPREIKGENPRFLKSNRHPKHFYKQLWETILAGMDWKGEIMNKKKNGELYWESISISPVKNDNGEITHFIAIKDDISKRKIDDLELILAKEKAEESDNLKSAFLSNLSHEIRTPINSILGFISLMKNKEISEDRRDYYYEVITNSANYLLDIIHDIIEISRIDANQVVIENTRFCLNDLLRKLQTCFYENPPENKTHLELDVVMDLEDDQSYILSDAKKIRQIFNTLLGNAYKFTHEGNIKFGYKIEHKKIKYFVIDTGIGVPDHLREKIFEKFRQAENHPSRQYSGTGLGLSIAKGLVEKMHGEIWCEPQEIGTKFQFVLPYNKVGKVVEPEEVLTVELSLKDKNIIIGEDTEDNYLVISEMLGSTGVNLIWKKNGLEVFEECEANPNIDLVLMDIRMPVMNGIKSMQKIKQIRPTLPVIAQTAFALDSDKQELLDKGFNDYIAKPFDMDELKNIIKKYIE